jgi:hypothetical protein
MSNDAGMREPPLDFDLGQLVDAGRRLEDAQWLSKAVGWAAAAAAELGQPALARNLLLEMLREPLVTADTTYVEVLPSMVRAALAAGDRGLAERLVEGPSDKLPLWAASLATAHAHIAEAGSPAGAQPRYEDAVRRWRSLGCLPELAFALEGWGRCIKATRNTDEAKPVLGEAQQLWRAMGATTRTTSLDRPTS